MRVLGMSSSRNRSRNRAHPRAADILDELGLERMPDDLEVAIGPGSMR